MKRTNTEITQTTPPPNKYYRDTGYEEATQIIPEKVNKPEFDLSEIKQNFNFDSEIDSGASTPIFDPEGMKAEEERQQDLADYRNMDLGIKMQLLLEKIQEHLNKSKEQMKPLTLPKKIQKPSGGRRSKKSKKSKKRKSKKNKRK
jgi:hypothetical protein